MQAVARRPAGRLAGQDRAISRAGVRVGVRVGGWAGSSICCGAGHAGGPAGSSSRRWWQGRTALTLTRTFMTTPTKGSNGKDDNLHNDEHDTTTVATTPNTMTMTTMTLRMTAS